jgi:hypothetical protein
MELWSAYFIPWFISNIVAILFLVTAIRKPKLARLLFALLFFWASWLNYNTAQNTPNDYLNYVILTPFSVYHHFING